MNLFSVYIAHILFENNIALCFDNLIFMRSKFLLFLVWFLKEAQHSSAEEQGDELNYFILLFSFGPKEGDYARRKRALLFQYCLWEVKKKSHHINWTKAFSLVSTWLVFNVNIFDFRIWVINHSGWIRLHSTNFKIFLWKLIILFVYFPQQAGNQCCLPVFLVLCVLLEPIFLFSRASLSTNVWWTGHSLSKWEELERLYELETSRL